MEDKPVSEIAHQNEQQTDHTEQAINYRVESDIKDDTEMKENETKGNMRKETEKIEKEWLNRVVYLWQRIKVHQEKRRLSILGFIYTHKSYLV